MGNILVNYALSMCDDAQIEE